MTVDEVKSALRFEAKMIQTYRERIEQLRSGSVGSQVGGTPVQGGVVGDGVSRAVCEIIRLEGLQKECVDRVWKEYLVLLDTREQRRVFKLRYIKNLAFKEIPLWIPECQERKTYYLHSEGLAVISEKLQKLDLQSKV